MQNNFAGQLHKAGLKATPARIAILESFPKTCQPLSAETLYAKVKSKKIDQATIYRNLNVLAETGILRKVDLHRDAAFYELADGHHHHHIVCTECKTVEEVGICDVDSLSAKALKTSKRFAEITEHSLELFGVCKSCQRS